jgi:hypothetical protein
LARLISEFFRLLKRFSGLCLTQFEFPGAIWKGAIIVVILFILCVGFIVS